MRTSSERAYPSQRRGGWSGGCRARGHRATRTDGAQPDGAPSHEIRDRAASTWTWRPTAGRTTSALGIRGVRLSRYDRGRGGCRPRRGERTTRPGWRCVRGPPPRAPVGGSPSPRPRRRQPVLAVTRSGWAIIIVRSHSLLSPVTRAARRAACSAPTASRYELEVLGSPGPSGDLEADRPRRGVAPRGGQVGLPHGDLVAERGARSPGQRVTPTSRASISTSSSSRSGVTVAPVPT